MFPIIKHLGPITALALLLLLASSLTAPLRAAEAVPGNGDIAPLPPLSLLEELQLGPSSFFYRQSGRPDPFMPFLAIRAAIYDQSEEEELTGLRRFEPGQLSLTAIVLGKHPPLAMAQDATGYGHIIRPGAAIGRSGIVESITATRVTIRQQLSSLTGEKEYRTIEMVLMQEGEKR